MSEEEIKKQYANGSVNADEVIKSLIDKFKTDKTSIDMQQLQLIVEYLIYKVDELQKENEKLRDVKNKAIGHINCCKTSLGNYLLSPSEVECLLDILKEGDIDE